MVGDATPVWRLHASIRPDKCLLAEHDFWFSADFNWVGKSGRLYQPFCLRTPPGGKWKIAPHPDDDSVTYVVSDTLLSEYMTNIKPKTCILVREPPSPVGESEAREGGLGVSSTDQSSQPVPKTDQTKRPTRFTTHKMLIQTTPKNSKPKRHICR